MRNKTDKTVKITLFTAQGRNSFSEKQQRLLDASGNTTYIRAQQELSSDQFIAQAYNATVVGVTRRTIKNIDRTIFSQLPNLRGIALYSTGFEWVDMDAAKELAITVTPLPNYSTESVAEHTMAMLLTMSRRTHLSFDKVRGNVPTTTSLRGFELAGKTIGVVGLGAIGKRFAHIAKAFNMNILYYDTAKKKSSYQKCDSLKELLQKSNIVTLLLPQIRGEKAYIGSEEINEMQDGAYLINSSRASLVDNNAIISAIEQKKIAGYAVDDTIELLTNAHVEPGRILQTGHTAWYSNEAMVRGTQQWCKTIVNFAHNFA